MINNISWGSYGSALSVLVLFYYIYVLWVYYRKDFIQRPAGIKRITEPISSIINHSKGDAQNDAIFPMLHSFTNELSAYLEQVAYGKPPKNEIIYGIQQITKKHPGIHESSYRLTVDQLIQSESKDKCAVILSEEEISQVWLV